jgi:hypothetical protein
VGLRAGLDVSEKRKSLFLAGMQTPRSSRFAASYYTDWAMPTEGLQLDRHKTQFMKCHGTHNNGEREVFIGW